MRFKFYPIESRIIDFLGFPECVAYEGGHKEELADHNYSDLIPGEQLKLFQAMEMALKPYEHRIGRFYFKGSSLPHLLAKQYAPFGFESEMAYLDHVETLDEASLERCFLTKVHAMAEDSDTADETWMQSMLQSSSAQLEYLEKLDLSDDERWKLSKLLLQPRKMTTEWVALMKELLPIFHAFYGPLERNVHSLGERMELLLKESEGAVLSELSNGLMTKELLPNGNLLISMIGAYSIELNTSSSVQYLRWGLNIESLIRAIKDAQESAMRERVLLFKNLGDKTRYDVVRFIAKGAESAKEIAEALNVSQATISYHIGNLTTSKLVLLEKVEGKYRYRVNRPLLEEACRLMMEDFK